MAVPAAEKIIARARSGERISVKDRRHAVGYLLATAADETNVSMADLFQVSERMIRLDKVALREEKARHIKEEDISLVIADIAINFDNQIKDIASSKKKCDLGTRTYLEHCRAIFNMELQKVAALQTLGYYPKSLGTLTQQKFEFIATVGVMEGEPGSNPTGVQLRPESDEAIEAEFTDVVEPGGDILLLDAPVDTNDDE